ncbi:hypothetical protein MHI24_30230 [Paenibacillus sp. FSL K6-1096]|uniref:hypothetical protein n=1 Tax=Paenibacillus sp. FSL K6-1096 TaxID=2921460 RepID=UPI0030EF88E6
MSSTRNLFTSKANKLLTGTLTAALALSTGGLTAFAATSTPASSVPTVQSATYSSTPAPLLPAPEAGLPPADAEPLSPPPGPAGIGPGPGGIDSTELLSTLGLSADELRSALEAGSSLGAVAQAQQVDPQKLVQLAASGLKTRLSQEYADGRITESVYQERLNEAANRAAAWISQTRPQPPVPGAEPAGLPPLGPGLDGMDRSELASLLGLSTSELAASLESGQSLADLAAANGSTTKVVNLVAEALTQELKERLARGDMWTDEYSAALQNVQTRAADVIQHQHPLPPHLRQDEK